MLRRDVGYIFDLWLQRAVVKDDGNPSAVVIPAGTHAVDHVANSSSLKPTKLEVLAGSKPNCALKNLETHRRKRVPDQQLADAWRNSLLESLASTRFMGRGAYTDSIWGLSRVWDVGFMHGAQALRTSSSSESVSRRFLFPVGVQTPQASANGKFS